MYRLDLSKNKSDTFAELRCLVVKDIAAVEASENVRFYMKTIPPNCLERWQQALTLGWPEVQYLLALHSVEKNPQYSSELLFRAAFQGFAPAQYGWGFVTTMVPEFRRM